MAAVYGPRENLKSDVMVMEGKLSCQFVISPFATPGAEVADERDTQKVCSGETIEDWPAFKIVHEGKLTFGLFVSSDRNASD